MTTYFERMADTWLSEMLAEVPAVMITGARASGKTTTALQHAVSVVRLDNPLEAAAFEADPDAALRGRAEPVLVDEWQACPSYRCLSSRSRAHTMSASDTRPTRRRSRTSGPISDS